MTAPVALVLLCASLLAPPRPPPTEAESRAFDEGVAALGRGDAAAAEASFRKGYDVARDPAFLVRVGESQERAGRAQAAVESYLRYLKEAPDAADRADIEARLGRLRAAAPALAADAAGPGASDEPVPGRTASAPSAAPGASAPGAAPAAATARPTAAQAADADGAVDDGTGPRPTSTLAKVGWVSVGLGALALGVAGFEAASAASAESDVNRLVNYRDEKTGAPVPYADVAKEYEDAMDRGRAADRLAKLSLATAGGLVGLGVILLVVDGATAPAPADVARARTGVAHAQTGVVASPDGLVTTARWSF